MEIYKDIKGYEGRFQVSNYGNVKAVKRIINNKYNVNRVIEDIVLKPSICNGGYYFVSLTDSNGIKKRIRIHRLVADNFLSNIDSKIDVNHIDGNKKNNHVSNLEWITRSENIKHAYKNNLRKPNKKLTDEEASIIKYKIIGVPQRILAQAFNCSQMVISNIKNNKTYQNV